MPDCVVQCAPCQISGYQISGDHLFVCLSVCLSACVSVPTPQALAICKWSVLCFQTVSVKGTSWGVPWDCTHRQTGLQRPALFWAPSIF